MGRLTKEDGKDALIFGMFATGSWLLARYFGYNPIELFASIAKVLSTSKVEGGPLTPSSIDC